MTFDVFNMSFTACRRKRKQVLTDVLYIYLHTISALSIMR